MKRLSFSAVPYSVYAMIFIAAPMILIVMYSCITTYGSGWRLTLDNYAKFFDFSNPIYMQVLLRSIYVALVSTVICLIIGYPMAYILAKLPPRRRTMLSFLFVLPMWMNFLLRTYAWMTLLERTGVINTLLNTILHRPEDAEPLMNIMYTQGAVILGNVYNFLPFMILPIYNSLSRLDNNLIEAAEDLGASGYSIFRRVIFPLSIPGVISGITMTFLPAVTTFIISKLLGGGQNALIGDLIEAQFSQSDWGFGSAMSVILMVLILLSMSIFNRFDGSSANGDGSVLM